jgi:DNA-binding NarL/FixJ family response regulator
MHLGSFCCILKAAIIDNEVRRMRVLLADDQTKVRSALRLLLEQEPGLSVVGEAVEAEDLLAQVEATQPDLVLLDWELPGLRTDDRLSVLRALCPQLKVIALSGQPEARRAALSAGADAFVSKGEPPERLLAAVEDCRPRQHRVENGK